MNVGVIIQARMGSSRLPGKVLLPLAGKTVLEHVIARAQKPRAVVATIVATTNNSADDAVATTALNCGAQIYRGSEEDVLDRYFQAAQEFKLKNIVRITADCPLIDPELINIIVKKYAQTQADYCSNTLIPTFPDGEDIEVFSFSTLKKAWDDAGLASEREHVTPYMKNENRFKVASYEQSPSLMGKRWTLDEPDDYRFLKMIFEELYPKNPFFGVKEVLEFLKKNPQIEKINSDIVRNAGYKKSLNQDKSLSKIVSNKVKG